MAAVNRLSLFGKLNDTAFKTLRAATNYCQQRGNPYVEISHWLQQILDAPGTDLHRLMQVFEIDEARLRADLTRDMEALRRGSTSVADFSSHIQSAIEEAWLWSSVEYGEQHVRTGAVLLGLLRNPTLKSSLVGISPLFVSIKAERFADEFQFEHGFWLRRSRGQIRRSLLL